MYVSDNLSILVLALYLLLSAALAEFKDSVVASSDANVQFLTLETTTNRVI